MLNKGERKDINSLLTDSSFAGTPGSLLSWKSVREESVDLDGKCKVKGQLCGEAQLSVNRVAIPCITSV